MDIDNITSIKIINREIVHIPITTGFFSALLAEKSAEIFPKHKRYIYISESIALS